MKGRAVVAIVVASILLLAVAGCDVLSSLFNREPTAKISVDTLPLKMGEERKFRSESTDPDGWIVEWKWDFDDGATSTEENPIHAFSRVGTLYVKLTVTDNDGETNYTTQSIDVTSPGPQLRGEIKTQGTRCSSCGSPYETAEEIIFSAQVDGDPIEYTWDFGDGYPGSGNFARHTYFSPGIYLVSLTVKDKDDVSNAYETQVTVEERCRPCLPKVWVDVSGCLRVGCPITLTGRFGDGYYQGCPKLAELLASKAPFTPEDYCDHYDDPCDCYSGCNNCGCRYGRWDWRIKFYPCCGDDVEELYPDGQSVTICASQPGIYKVTGYYTCAGNTNKTKEVTIEIL